MIPDQQRQLFVCCDGTWFRPEARFPSHIGRIARLAATRPGGERDLVYYTRGVGSRYGLDKWIGGGFGEGLDTNVKDAYNFLAHNYIPPSDHYRGDKIFMFGFSRGAYTVRSLAAMIDRVGLLKRGSVMRLGDAYRTFRTKPGENAMDEKTGEPISLEYDIHVVDIEFVGVFDTVGAKGIPFFGLDQTRRFTDLMLPSRVKHGRHAMGLNEPRSQFRPAVWEGVSRRPEGVAEPNAPARVAQVWFAGVHSDVGGGYDREAMGKNGHLGSHTLGWMLDEARECGLKFDHETASGLVTALGSKGDVNTHNFNLHDSMNAMYFVMDKLLYLQRLIMRADFRFHRRYVRQSAAVNQSIHRSAADAFLRDAAVERDDPLENSILLSHSWAVGRSVQRFRFSRNVELKAVADRFGDLDSPVIDIDTVARPKPGIAKRIVGVALGLAGLAAIVAAIAALIMNLPELWDWLPDGARLVLLIVLLLMAIPPLWTPYLLYKRLYSYRFLR